jgi:hypothetical protein
LKAKRREESPVQIDQENFNEAVMSLRKLVTALSKLIEEGGARTLSDRDRQILEVGMSAARVIEQSISRGSFSEEQRAEIDSWSTAIQELYLRARQGPELQ